MPRAYLVPVLCTCCSKWLSRRHGGHCACRSEKPRLRRVHGQACSFLLTDLWCKYFLVTCPPSAIKIISRKHQRMTTADTQLLQFPLRSATPSQPKAALSAGGPLPAYASALFPSPRNLSIYSGQGSGPPLPHCAQPTMGSLGPVPPLGSLCSPQHQC